jgi:hypothetical protein
MAGNGWLAKMSYTLLDRIGEAMIPIDLKETLENSTPYGRANWPNPSAGTWHVTDWDGNTYPDFIGACWFGSPPPTPVTTTWNTSGTTPFLSDTQKFWIGTVTGLQGYCVIKKGVVFYTDHFSYENTTSPIPLISPNPCALGQYAS